VVRFQDFDSKLLATDPENPWCLENLHLLSDYLHCIEVREGEPCWLQDCYLNCACESV
jgi:hypothetical protein